MGKKINRRTFIKKSVAIGATSIIGSGFTYDVISKTAKKKIDISVVKGENYYNNTHKAIDALGGMGRFVPKNSTVALLPNAQRNNPGTYTNPEIVKAVIKMCFDAGAKAVNCLSWLPEKNWKDTGLADVIGKSGANLVIADLRDETEFRTVPVIRGKALREAQIMKVFYKNDVFINMPVTKDHAGNKFTGTLKNLMGLNFSKNNRLFHKKGWKTDISSITHLDQCIADLNTIIKPHLCVVDATEFIITNGPFGPGKLIKPQKVVAGTDPVAIDSYCCKLWGLDPGDIIMINKAHEHKLGRMKLSKVKIKELVV